MCCNDARLGAQESGKSLSSWENFLGADKAAVGRLRDVFAYSTNSPIDTLAEVGWLRARGADLTFATRLAANSRSECQIQSSTKPLYLLVVLLILTFA